MSDMTTAFSKEELELLIKHVFIATWVMNAHKGEPTEQEKRNEALEQKVLALAYENGCKEWIQYYESEKEYLISGEKADEFLLPIDEFTQETFWQELITLLAERDFHENHEEKEIEGMDPETRYSCLESEEEKYGQEFEENGVDNLRIVR